MTARGIVALDIGSTKVACAIGLPHEQAGGFELLGSSLVAFPALAEAWMSDPLMVSRTIEQAIEATAVSADFHRALVAINHPRLVSEHVRSAIHVGDEPVTVRGQDMARLQDRALDQVIGIDREPLVVERLGCAGNGFEGVRNPQGLSATRLVGDFHVVTMPVAARRAVVQAVESAGLEVAKLTFTMPAALASMMDEGLLQKRVLMVDAGGLNTDVGLFADGSLQALRVVPWGGLKAAAHIAKTLQVTLDQATTWSLEGYGCRKPEVRTYIEEAWGTLEQAMAGVLAEQPRPDLILLAGRAALMDGFAEWVERAMGVTTTLCRSHRTERVGDLWRQLGLSPVIGLLEMATQGAPYSSVTSDRFFNRLIGRTRTILTEYF